MASVTYDHATLRYPGAKKPSVDNVNLDIRDGEFLVLVGPSGCGKSTTLRMLAGLEEVTEGRILIDGQDVTGMAPKDRDVAMVFQNYALYPHMTVRDNMGFALKMAGETKAAINERVEEVAETLGLVDLLDRKPKALSGGQRQRVAMGRAIVRKPRVFLMDEPLSNLDAKLRVHTRAQISAIQHKLNVTTVYVTHDQTEALTMGDRIAVLDKGVLQQVGTPEELYNAPQNVFVAGFIGSPAMNLLTCSLSNDSDGNVVATHGEISVPVPVDVAAVAHAEDAAEIVIGFRPEAVEPAVEDAKSIPLTIDYVEELGSDSYVYGHLGAAQHDLEIDDPETIVLRMPPRTAPGAGELISVSIDPTKVHYFSAISGKRY